MGVVASLMDTRQSLLERLKSDISQACSEKNLDNLERLLRVHRVVLMTEDVEKHVLTQDTVMECLREAGSRAPSSAGQDAAGSTSLYPPGLDCASLVLAVLLARKLLAKNVINPDNILISDMWMYPPHTLLYTALSEAMGEVGAFSRWLEYYGQSSCSEFTKHVSSVLMTSAVLGFPSLFQSHPWKYHPPSAFAMYTPAIIVLTTLAGDQISLQRILSNQRPDFLVKYSSLSLPYLLTLAQSFGGNNVQTSMEVFKKHYKQSGLSVPNFLTCLLRLVCGYDNSMPGSLTPRSDSQLELLVKYADFFFDASVVPDIQVRNMSWYPWVPVRDFLIMLHLDSLHVGVCRLCFGVLESLCDRRGAGLFLLALQDEYTLEEVPSTHRKELILYLAECQQETQRRFPPISSCELCREPITSIFLWSMGEDSPLDSSLDPEDIAPYCVDSCRKFLKRFRKSSNMRLCDMHVGFIPNSQTLDEYLDTCESYKSDPGQRKS